AQNGVSACTRVDNQTRAVDMGTDMVLHGIGHTGEVEEIITAVGIDGSETSLVELRGTSDAIGTAARDPQSFQVRQIGEVLVFQQTGNAIGTTFINLQGIGTSATVDGIAIGGQVAAREVIEEDVVVTGARVDRLGTVKQTSTVTRMDVVVAVTTVDGVVAGTGKDGVGAGATVDQVVARTGIDPVRTGGQGIGCNTGPDHIVAVAGVDGITTQSTLDDVVAIASINVIVAVVAFDGIVARTGIDVIVAFATEHGVVAFTGIDVVVVAVTKDGVVAFATVDGVFASATADGVVAVTAHDGISTSTAVQVVRTRGSPDGIVAGTGKYSAAEAVFTDTIDIDVVVTIIEPVADGLTV